MITGEEIPVSIQQHRVTSGMSRSRDRQQVLIDFDRLMSHDHSLNACEGTADVVAMHNPLRFEVIDPLLMIGDVITMS